MTKIYVNGSDSDTVGLHWYHRSAIAQREILTAIEIHSLDRGRDFTMYNVQCTISRYLYRKIIQLCSLVRNGL